MRRVGTLCRLYRCTPVIIFAATVDLKELNVSLHYMNPRFPCHSRGRFNTPGVMVLVGREVPAVGVNSTVEVSLRHTCDKVRIRSPFFLGLYFGKVKYTTVVFVLGLLFLV